MTGKRGGGDGESDGAVGGEDGNLGAIGQAERKGEEGDGGWG